VLAATALVLVTTALAVRLIFHDGPAPTSVSAGSPASAVPPSSTTPATGPSTTSPTVPSTSTSPTIVTAAGAPDLSSMTPSSGATGQQVVISGTNFVSSDGTILVYFANVVAPTSCPVENSCTVTVPALTGVPPTVPVTMTTASGTSNALTFSYQPSAAATTGAQQASNCPPHRHGAQGQPRKRRAPCSTV
jgi:hypothetical protein